MRWVRVAIPVLIGFGCSQIAAKGHPVLGGALFISWSLWLGFKVLRDERKNRALLRQVAEEMGIELPRGRASAFFALVEEISRRVAQASADRERAMAEANRDNDPSFYRHGL